MSRKHSNFARDILPDPKFGSEMITRFVNMVMESGKKSVAEKIVYGAITTISEKNKSADAINVLALPALPCLVNASRGLAVHRYQQAISNKKSQLVGEVFKCLGLGIQAAHDEQGMVGEEFDFWRVLVAQGIGYRQRMKPKIIAQPTPGCGHVL